MLSRTGTGTRRINLRKKTDFDFRIREISANFRFEKTKKTDCWIWRVFNNDAKLSLVRTGLFPFGILGLEGAQFLSLCDDRIARHFFFFFDAIFTLRSLKELFHNFLSILELIQCIIFWLVCFHIIYEIWASIFLSSLQKFPFIPHVRDHTRTYIKQHISIYVNTFFFCLNFDHFFYKSRSIKKNRIKQFSIQKIKEKRTQFIFFF